MREETSGKLDRILKFFLKQNIIVLIIWLWYDDLMVLNAGYLPQS